MNHISFWSHYAGSYDRFMKKDAPAYQQMLELIRPAVKGRIVLELATGTGFLARQKAQIMGRFGFPLQHRWTSEEYLAFLAGNGWHIQKNTSIKASFPLTYVECSKGACL